MTEKVAPRDLHCAKGKMLMHTTGEIALSSQFRNPCHQTTQILLAVHYVLLQWYRYIFLPLMRLDENRKKRSSPAITQDSSFALVEQNTTPYNKAKKARCMYHILFRFMRIDDSKRSRRELMTHNVECRLDKLLL